MSEFWFYKLHSKGEETPDLMTVSIQSYKEKLGISDSDCLAKS